MSRLNIVFLTVFVGLIVWITLFSPEAVNRIQRGVMVAFRPFIKASSAVENGVLEAGAEPLDATRLRNLVEELRRERDRLRLEVIQLDELLEENNDLRRALRYRENAPLAVAAARVMSRKPLTWYNTLMIDKGSLDGIAPDSPVIIPVGEKAALVGKISEVLGEHSAIVLLLTDEMCQVAAKFENSKDQGILSGQRGALKRMPDLQLRYLSKEVDAAAGRRVISSGAGGIFPPDLLLGTVLSLEVETIDATATVKPAVNFEELTDVFVMLPTPSGETRGADLPAGEPPAAEPEPES